MRKFLLILFVTTCFVFNLKSQIIPGVNKINWQDWEKPNNDVVLSALYDSTDLNINQIFSENHFAI